MGIGHVLKLGSKFLLRGVVYRMGKKVALKGGKVGIGAGALIYGGILAYTLLKECTFRKSLFIKSTAHTLFTNYYADFIYPIDGLRCP